MFDWIVALRENKISLEDGYSIQKDGGIISNEFDGWFLGTVYIKSD